MKFSLYLVCLFWGIVSVISLPAEERTKIEVDLDGDGKKETITWEKFASTEEDGDFYQLRVIDHDGKSARWEGPKLTDSKNPLIIGNWHYGRSFPQAATDIDLDGNLELITPVPASDLSPTWFSLLRWTGNGFQLVDRGALIEQKKNSGFYPWNDSDAYEGRWISGFRGMKDNGDLLVDVIEYTGGDFALTGAATVKPVANGIQITGWVKPLSRATDPDEPGTIYRARLSAGDHKNSAGTRLTSVADILRQDRANVHKGKGDPEDQGDTLFDTIDKRHGMGVLNITSPGFDMNQLEKIIIDGTPLVEVNVSDTRLTVKILSE